MLNSGKCYMLDCEAELFVWMGRGTSITERKTSISAAEVRFSIFFPFYFLLLLPLLHLLLLRTLVMQECLDAHLLTQQLSLNCAAWKSLAIISQELLFSKALRLTKYEFGVVMHALPKMYLIFQLVDFIWHNWLTKFPTCVFFKWYHPNYILFFYGQ